VTRVSETDEEGHLCGLLSSDASGILPAVTHLGPHRCAPASKDTIRPINKAGIEENKEWLLPKQILAHAENRRSAQRAKEVNHGAIECRSDNQAHA
jgi:hypothetical protein